MASAAGNLCLRGFDPSNPSKELIIPASAIVGAPTADCVLSEDVANVGTVVSMIPEGAAADVGQLQIADADTVADDHDCAVGLACETGTDGETISVFTGGTVTFTTAEIDTLLGGDSNDAGDDQYTAGDEFEPGRCYWLSGSSAFVGDGLGGTADRSGLLTKFPPAKGGGRSYVKIGVAKDPNTLHLDISSYRQFAG